MALELFHQVGHNSNWNISSFEEDKAGDGLIFSPVHQPINKIEELSVELKDRSIFDPQFYLPNSQKKKLHTYDFFPEIISDGFDTLDFGAHAYDAAKACVNFQLSNGFGKIVIPARFFPQMVTDYREQQEAYTVIPFLENINEANTDLPIYITLPLTSHMILDKGYRTNLLNWITKFPEIDGVYTFIGHERNTKQIQDTNILYEALQFFRDLKDSNLDLIIGYTNTESLLYSLAGDSVLTFGTFENTRMFSIDKFLVSDSDRRGPKARIYLPGLLNWVQYEQAREIRENIPDLWDKIYVPTEHSEAALNSPVEPTFNQPDLYKHHFIVFYNQFSSLKNEELSGRHSIVRGWLNDAQTYYQEITNNYIDLEPHGAGDHIQPWLTTINKYYREFLR